MRLLLVEDNPGDARLVEFALDDAGAEDLSLEHVVRLADAEARLAGGRFDAVLLDLSLPDSHGLATVERVRVAAPDAPIVVLTGLADESTALEALHVGAQDYLPKGTDGAGIMRALRYAIERQRTERALRTAERRYRDLFDEAPVMYVTTRHGAGGPVVSDCNDLFARTLGYDRGDVAGRPLETFYFDANPLRAADLADFRVAVEAGSTNVERALRRRDGTAIETVMQLRPDYGEDGTIVGARAAYVDVSALKHTEALMRAARDEAEAATRRADAANREKSRFLSVVGNDIRTPMTGIIGYADLLMEGLLGPLTPEQADALGRIKSGSARLMDLLNEVLDLSRIEASRLDLAPEPIDLRAMLESVGWEFAAAAEARGVVLRYDFPTALPTIAADPARLRQIVAILIGNATRWTEVGAITVSACSAADGVEISVTDTGPGIDPAVIPSLFEEFGQAGRVLSDSDGSVLGLAIARKLTELHGGRIGAESQPGTGSRFTVWLPSAPGSKQALPVAAGHDESAG